ncbi:MAG: ATP-binding protein [Breznakibacter sp.]
MGSDWELLSNAVEMVFKANFSSEPDSLFNTVVSSISQLTGANCVLIGKFEASRNSIRTLAIVESGKTSPNAEYPLIGTVSESVIGNVSCVYTNHVNKLFPNDTYLQGHNIQGYAGVPLFYDLQKPMGVLVAMFDHEIHNPLAIEQVLKAFSVQVASEIKYREYNHIMQMQTNELNLLLDQVKAKNVALDNSVVELEKAHAFAEESNQLKTAFLANLSHEIRTPMNVMLGFAELLKSEVLSHEERIEYIDIINQNGFQLLKIMDNLIEVSKFQSKKVTENPRPISLNQIIDRCFYSYKDYIRLVQKPVEIKVHKDFKDDDDVVMADHDGIAKVLDQLVDNAVKFTHHGHVKLSYQCVGDHIRFTVQDSGIGVPQGMEEKIFELFRQADLRASREFGGNGLGLAIARKYSELMNGRVWVETNEEPGACFCFEIPYVKHAAVNENLIRL